MMYSKICLLFRSRICAYYTNFDLVKKPTPYMFAIFFDVLSNTVPYPFDEVIY